jgi:hypothetical protein
MTHLPEFPIEELKRDIIYRHMNLPPSAQQVIAPE